MKKKQKKVDTIHIIYRHTLMTRDDEIDVALDKKVKTLKTLDKRKRRG